MNKLKCSIYDCEKEADYHVLAYGMELLLCWKHLKDLHTPENDENIRVIGDRINGVDFF